MGMNLDEVRKRAAAAADEFRRKIICMVRIQKMKPAAINRKQSSLFLSDALCAELISV